MTGIHQEENHIKDVPLNMEAFYRRAPYEIDNQHIRQRLLDLRPRLCCGFFSGQRDSITGMPINDHHDAITSSTKDRHRLKSRIYLSLELFSPLLRPDITLREKAGQTFRAAVTMLHEMVVRGDFPATISLADWTDTAHYSTHNRT